VTLVAMQQKKIELRASLIQELEHKKKVIENERNTMELTGGKCSALKHTFVPMDVPDIRFQFAGMSGIGFHCPVLARFWI